MTGVGRGTVGVTAVAILTAVGAAVVLRPALSSDPEPDRVPVVRCSGQLATIVGTTGDDTLRGTAKADVIVGLGGDDRILGLGGDDIICGGGGHDEIDGGDGDDVLHGDSGSRGARPAGADLLVGGTGHDSLHGDRPFTGVSGSGEGEPYDVGDFLDGGPGDDLLAASLTTEHDGGSLRPTTIGFATSARAVTVDLAAGTARGQGHDTIRRPIARTAALAVVGSRFDDTLRGTPDPRLREQFVAGPGDDVVRGQAGITSFVETVGEAGPLGRGDYGLGQEFEGQRVGRNTYSTPRAGHLDARNGSGTFTGGAGSVAALEGGGSYDVTLGGPDTFVTARAGRPHGRVRMTGPGAMYSVDAGTRAIRIDAHTGAVTVGGEPLGVVTGVATWNVGTTATVRFTGTDRAETVEGNAGSVAAGLAGGDDRVIMTLSTTSARIDGGAGRDQVFLFGSGDDKLAGQCRAVEEGCTAG